MIIKKLKQSYSVKTLCEVFNVHRSSYHYWLKRPTVINAETVKLRSLVSEAHAANIIMTLMMVIVYGSCRLKFVKAKVDCCGQKVLNCHQCFIRANRVLSGSHYLDLKKQHYSRSVVDRIEQKGA